ncbi:HD-GYP domain-containing protein [Sphingomonas sp. ID0503]|uniref:HD-GYP domain-containing protein n=1 Tax=Sphingomonas sp. ID0503 TaxID=3399691 RepID=UPI003AFB5C29
MLKRITCDEVRLGMFIRSFEGSWLSHPFWRKSFLLTDPKDVAKVRGSGVSGVIIDTDEGLDTADAPLVTARRVEDEAPAYTPSAPTQRTPARPRVGSAVNGSEPTALSLRLGLQQPCSAAEEVSRAKQIVAKSKGQVLKLFGEARLGKAVRAGDLMPLVDEIAASVTRNANALIGIVRLKNKDEYTYMHSVAVCALMVNFARQMEMDEAVVRDVGMAGLLHDIGKMAVPEQLLSKPGRLTDDEFDQVRGHCERGRDILLESGQVPDIAIDVCLHHHEKVDGTGYPYRLAGDQISLYARMAAICDVYDAVTSARVYKEAWEPGDALSRMVAWQGHFDEELLSKFLRSISIYPVGMLVRLRSNRLGIVLGAAGKDLTSTRVRAFYSIMDRAIVAPEDLVVGQGRRGGDQILNREAPERWGIADWDLLSTALLAGKGLADLRDCRRRDAA